MLLKPRDPAPPGPPPRPAQPARPGVHSRTLATLGAVSAASDRLFAGGELGELGGDVLLNLPDGTYLERRLLFAAFCNSPTWRAILEYRRLCTNLACCYEDIFTCTYFKSGELVQYLMLDILLFSLMECFFFTVATVRVSRNPTQCSFDMA